MQSVSLSFVVKKAVFLTIIAFVCCLLLGPSTVFCEQPKYVTIEGVPFSQSDNSDLLADIFVPTDEGPHAGVLLIHGGGWMAGDRSELRRVARRLAPLGFTVMAIDYRLAPKDKFPAQINDCRAALRWMKQNAAKYKIDTQRLGVWGYSAGGHLAALLGTTNPLISAVVAGGAPCDFRPVKPDNGFLAYWLGGTPREVPENYKKASPAYHISEDDPPFFFYHGQYDFLVPIDQPRKMAALLQKSSVPAELYTVVKKGHVGALRDSKAVDLGIEFMCKHLLP